MKLRLTRRFARLLGLCAVAGLVAQALAYSYPAEPAVDPLPSNCNTQWLPGVIGTNSGCFEAASCGFLSPNVGVTWSTEYYCCYTAGYLTGIQGPWCLWGFNGGCCNELDYAPLCPDISGGTCPVTGP